MTTLVLDTGALIALVRNDRAVWAMLRNAADNSAQVSVPAGVVAQAWRGGSRQALLSRVLTHCDEVPLEGALARATGLMCGRAGRGDHGVTHFGEPGSCDLWFSLSSAASADGGEGSTAV
jgi:hypothetical protein